VREYAAGLAARASGWRPGRRMGLFGQREDVSFRPPLQGGGWGGGRQPRESALGSLGPRPGLGSGSPSATKRSPIVAGVAASAGGGWHRSWRRGCHRLVLKAVPRSGPGEGFYGFGLGMTLFVRGTCRAGEGHSSGRPFRGCGGIYRMVQGLRPSASTPGYIPTALFRAPEEAGSLPGAAEAREPWSRGQGIPGRRVWRRVARPAAGSPPDSWKIRLAAPSGLWGYMLNGPGVTACGLHPWLHSCRPCQGSGKCRRLGGRRPRRVSPGREARAYPGDELQFNDAGGCRGLAGRGVTPRGGFSAR
jgi:hypothetical protein